jgi:hypothetical protein
MKIHLFFETGLVYSMGVYYPVRSAAGLVESVRGVHTPLLAAGFFICHFFIKKTFI